MKTALSQGQVLHGTIVTINDSCVSEALSECFDWLWIDMEHAPYSLDDVRTLTQAVSKKCKVLVRIPVNSEEWIQRVLDLGVDGIIVPHVNSYEEAKKIAEVSFYPPLGRRSVGCCRSSNYGVNADFSQQANVNRVVAIQIEDVIGVNNINEIVKVEGIDAIIIGPYDLSGSYNKLGQVDDSDVVAAIDKVLEACKKQRIPIGIFAKDVVTAQKYSEKGFQLVAIGVDIQYLWRMAQETIDSLKGVYKGSL